jgi:hypothetical protein
MPPQHCGFPLRWVLPSVQLVLCLALLWPMRGFLLFGVTQSIHSYFGPTAKSGATLDLGGINIIVPRLTPERQRRADAAAKLWEIRMTAPLALNFPVLIAQLPYILLNPAKREWVPKGMFFDVWRALSWPIAGMFFWWFLGRGIEALFAARRSVARPRISWVEVTFALILSGIGLAILVGMLTSTPDDRRDAQFMTLVAGALLWGILATSTIAARLLQRQIAKRRAAEQSAMEPSQG